MGGLTLNFPFPAFFDVHADGKFQLARRNDANLAVRFFEGRHLHASSRWLTPVTRQMNGDPAGRKTALWLIIFAQCPLRAAIYLGSLLHWKGRWARAGVNQLAGCGKIERGPAVARLGCPNSCLPAHELFVLPVGHARVTTCSSSTDCCWLSKYICSIRTA